MSALLDAIVLAILAGVVAFVLWAHLRCWPGHTPDKDFLESDSWKKEDDEPEL